MKIKLEELAAAFQTSDVLQGYVDLRRGRVVLLEDGFHADAREERGEEDILEHVLSIEDDWENYVPIPNAYDRNERDIMEGFARTLELPLQKEFLRALEGSGAVGRFCRQIRRYGLLAEWEKFRKERLEDLAREWCGENDIEWE